MRQRKTEIMRYIWRVSMQFSRAVVLKMCRIFHVNLTDNTWNTLEQFFRFCVVGCSNVVISLSTYYIVIYAFGEKYYLFGQTSGFILGIFNSYVLNSKFVFSTKGSKTSEVFLKMCVCYLFTYFVQTGLLFALISFFSFSAKIAPIVAIIVTIPANFFLNKTWSFKEPPRN